MSIHNNSHPSNYIRIIYAYSSLYTHNPHYIRILLIAQYGTMGNRLVYQHGEQIYSVLPTIYFLLIY